MRIWRVALVALCAMWLAPAMAHELWIEPLRFRLDPGSMLQANLRLGQQFRGDRLPYLPANAIRLEDVGPAGAQPIGGTLGDIPAIALTPAAPGLQVLVYHSVAERVGWAEWRKFADFVNDHGLGWVLDEHRRRGLPETGFTEAYTRCAKALVQVGPVAGADHVVGLPAEIVAEANPYALTAGETLPVRLLWRGRPQPAHDIRVFRRFHEAATFRDVTTDAGGRAVVPLDGPGIYLLNAVLMAEGSEKPRDVWHSYWASLVFEVAG